MKILKIILEIILSLIIGALSLLLILWSGLYLYGTIDIEEGVTVDYLKGVWGPSPMDHFGFFFDLDQIKADGINTISIGPLTSHPLLSFLYKPITAAIIKRAHQKGMAVHLAPVSWGPGFDVHHPHPEMEEALTQTAIEWAQFAERYKVEFYSPQNEPDVVLGAEGVNVWAKKILPEVKKHYQGITVLKLGLMVVEAGEGGEGEYEVQFASWGEYDPNRRMYVSFPESAGWDYLMVDIFPPDEMDQPEKFPEDLGRLLDAASDWATKQENRGVMIGEFAYPRSKPEFGGIAGIMPGPIVSPEEQAQRTSEYLEAAMPKVKGIIYCGWILPGYSLKGHPVEKTIEEKFLELNGS